LKFKSELKSTPFGRKFKTLKTRSVKNAASTGETAGYA